MHVTCLQGTSFPIESPDGVHVIAGIQCISLLLLLREESDGWSYYQTESYIPDSLSFRTIVLCPMTYVYLNFQPFYTIDLSIYAM